MLDGLRFMREAVLDSYPRWEPGGGVPRRPFRLDPEVRSAPSHYVIDVEVDGVRYTYGFVLDDERILEEWLYSYPEKRRRVIFERAGGDFKFGSTISPHRGRVEVLEELTRPNALFLSIASQANMAESLPMYRWFRSTLAFRYPSSFEFDDEAIDFLTGSPRRRQLVVELLRLADLGIEDFRAERRITARGVRKKLVFVHKGSTVPFELEDESAGTRAWIGMLRDALAALETGGVLMVDEVETSLHPWLTARIPTLFQDSGANPSDAQLICTTHDTTLLGPTLDDPVLHRDQVWFTNKDDRGATSVYPLSDFRPRKGENTARRYPGGSYDAVPKLFPEDLTDAVRVSRSDVEA
ncbi:MAG TPA: ATP-binding protein [Pseudonocardiaceae bacterium]|nr:ATP-binding protein [Pseudonocardiaceae bacterium]